MGWQQEEKLGCLYTSMLFRETVNSLSFPSLCMCVCVFEKLVHIIVKVGKSKIFKVSCQAGASERSDLLTSNEVWGQMLETRASARLGPLRLFLWTESGHHFCVFTVSSLCKVCVLTSFL